MNESTRHNSLVLLIVVFLLVGTGGISIPFAVKSYEASRRIALASTLKEIQLNLLIYSCGNDPCWGGTPLSNTELAIMISDTEIAMPNGDILILEIEAPTGTPPRNRSR